MIYLQLFLNFLKIGALSFGGGYGMIAVVKETMISNAWLTETEFLDFVAVAESTPGPLAVNMATFVGSSQGGFLGALTATFGVILPSFVIILLIAAIINNLLKFAGVQAALDGIRPAITALIFATAITMILSVIFGITKAGDAVHFDFKGLTLFATLAIITAGYKKIAKKSISPILLIIFSAIYGIIVYS